MDSKVSIITTTYNADSFINQTIYSILAQDYENFEHIIVDDGSKDNTAKQIKEFNDPRIRFTEAGRVGRGKSLNIAFQQCKGEFIAVQDADDLSHPNRLSIEIECLKKYTDISLIGTGDIIIDPRESLNWEKSVFVNSITDNIVDVSKSLVYYNPVSHTSVMMRKKALQDIGGYNEARKNLFDWDLYVRLAASGHRIAKLSFPLIAKRRHPNQFFEGRERLKYVFSSLMLQMQAALLLNNSLLPVFFMPSLFCYRLLPGSMRMVVRRQLKLTLRKH